MYEGVPVWIQIDKTRSLYCFCVSVILGERSKLLSQTNRLYERERERGRERDEEIKSIIDSKRLRRFSTVTFASIL